MITTQSQLELIEQTASRINNGNWIKRESDNGYGSRCATGWLMHMGVQPATISQMQSYCESLHQNSIEPYNDSVNTNVDDIKDLMRGFVRYVRSIGGNLLTGVDPPPRATFKIVDAFDAFAPRLPFHRPPPSKLGKASKHMTNVAEPPKYEPLIHFPSEWALAVFDWDREEVFA